MLFFDVTESLFQRLIEGIKALISAISPIIGSLSVVLVVVITIGLLGSKSKKKYINDNFVLVVGVICVEFIISLLFFNLIFVKINLFVITVCILVIVLNAKTKKKAKIKKIEEVK